MGLTIEKCLEAWTNSLKQLKVNVDMAFLGDSLTYYGDFASVFPDKIICNLGLRGDTLDGMARRVEQVHIIQPKVIVVMVGINDVGLLDELEFEANYQHLLHKISSVCPNSVVIVHSILPVNSTEFGSLSCNNKQIDRANQIIKRLACYYGYRYLDLYRLYIQEGQLRREMTIDGIHLKYNAYKIWYDSLACVRALL